LAFGDAACTVAGVVDDVNINASIHPDAFQCVVMMGSVGVIDGFLCVTVVGPMTVIAISDIGRLTARRAPVMARVCAPRVDDACARVCAIMVLR
jgi:hypothetical protein